MKTYLVAFLTSLLLAVLIGFLVIPLLKKLKLGQNILSYLSEHDYKNGTPTMGGIIFVISSIIAFFMWSDSNKYLAIVCITVGISYMVVGFLDDYLKIQLKRNEGLSPKQKMIFEFAIAIIVSVFLFDKGLTKVFIPFTKRVLDFSWWIIPFSIFIFLATTNSVNLTDGLDGLAAGVSYLYFACIAVIITLQININPDWYANYLEYKSVALLSCCLTGGLIGYLLFNTHKASVFMGDTGSLSLGGFVAIIAIITGNTFFIPIIGITFVISSISVILQVIYFKRTKKRIFLMAPLHHHFQHKGYNETKIAVGYKLITLLFGLLCIISYL